MSTSQILAAIEELRTSIDVQFQARNNLLHRFMTSVDTQLSHLESKIPKSNFLFSPDAQPLLPCRPPPSSPFHTTHSPSSISSSPIQSTFASTPSSHPYSFPSLPSAHPYSFTDPPPTIPASHNQISLTTVPPTPSVTHPSHSPMFKPPPPSTPPPPIPPPPTEPPPYLLFPSAIPPATSSPTQPPKSPPNFTYESPSVPQPDILTLSLAAPPSLSRSVPNGDVVTAGGSSNLYSPAASSVPLVPEPPPPPRLHPPPPPMLPPPLPPPISPSHCSLKNHNPAAIKNRTKYLIIRGYEDDGDPDPSGSPIPAIGKVKTVDEPPSPIPIIYFTQLQAMYWANLVDENFEHRVWPIFQRAETNWLISEKPSSKLINEVVMGPKLLERPAPILFSCWIMSQSNNLLVAHMQPVSSVHNYTKAIDAFLGARTIQLCGEPPLDLLGIPR